MFFLPDYNVRDDAKKARRRVLPRARRLHRPGRPGTQQRQRRPAGDGGRRRRSATAGCSAGWPRNWPAPAGPGVAPWEALHTLGDELGLPELDDLADIMRLSGEEGAADLRQPAGPLRRHARRDAHTTNSAKANEVGERMSIPMSLLGVIFLAMLVAPSLLRLVFTGAAPHREPPGQSPPARRLRPTTRNEQGHLSAHLR